MVSRVTSPRFFWFRSLVFRSVFFVVLSCFVSLTSVGYFLMEREENQEYELFEENLTITMRIVTDSLALAVWNFNEAQALDGIVALEEIPSFCGAKIIDVEGKTFVSHKFSSDYDKRENANYADNIIDDHVHIKYMPIKFVHPTNTNSGGLIGYLELCYDENNIQEYVADQTNIILYGMLLILSILTLVTILSLRVIFRPLSTLRLAMSALRHGLKKIDDPRLLKNNEVGALTRQYNEMIDGLLKGQRSLEEKIEEAHHESQKNKLFAAIVSSANQSGAGTLNASASDEVIRYALDRLCAFWGWSLAHCYRLDKAGIVLESTHIWSSSHHDRFSAFMDMSHQTIFIKGKGVPGYVWENAMPAWIEKIDSKDGPRLQAAMDAGFRSMIAFPLWVGNTFYGVMEFFAQNRVPHDSETNEFMQAIMRQIGIAIEREQVQDELNQAMQRAEDANTAKTVFFSNMSHELRTPMHAILNYAEMGQKQLEKNNVERLPKYLGNIHRAGTRLLLIINELLDFTKLDAGKVELHCTNEKMDAIVEYAIDELSSLLDQKGLHVAIQAESPLPTVYVDKDRMVQVMVNLLSNAIKYTPHSGDITVGIAQDLTEYSVVRVTVKNQGPAIPEEDLERIFNPFEQSDEAKEVGGTGLGLPICRQIVEAHQGTIWAENIVDYGVAMHFTLPKSMT